jgi:hypothetical protein
MGEGGSESGVSEWVQHVLSPLLLMVAPLLFKIPQSGSARKVFENE